MSGTEGTAPRPGADEVADRLRGLVATGMLAPGDRLPSVRQLSRDLGVAPGTVAKAFQQLDADGVVVTRRGSGTRVADHGRSLPEPVLAALREAVRSASRLGVEAADVRAALDAMWAGTPPTDGAGSDDVTR